MAGTDESQLHKLGPFPAGINNKAQLTQGPVNQNGVQAALREAVNVDLDAAGWLRRRRGQVNRVSATHAHSLFCTASHLLAWVDGNFNAYRVNADGSLTYELGLALNLGDRFITCTTDDVDVYASNGLAQWRIDADTLSVHPFWPGTPDPVSVSATGAGGLARGQYEVSVTVIDADGRESGASSPAVVMLTTGQGIAVTFPAGPVGTSAWRVYVSPPDGDVLYRCAQLPANTTSYAISAHPAGAALKTAWQSLLPPCTTLRYGHGRILGANGPLLVWSEPYRLGLMQDTNYLHLGQEVTLLEPVGEGGDGAGWWASDHKRTYFMAGANPAEWTPVVRYPHPAVPGCSVVASGAIFGLETTAPVAFWLARNGVFCIGLPGGQVMPLQDASLALPVDAERGAAAVLLFDGLRQILATSYGSLPNTAAASDSADITIRRNGVIVD